MTTQKQYLVEHLDPDFELWSKLEYLSISSLLSPSPSSSSSSSSSSSKFSITSVPSSILSNLPPELVEFEKAGKLSITGDEVVRLMEKEGIRKEEVCLLDPRGERELRPEDGEGFRWFVFGGILGW